MLGGFGFEASGCPPLLLYTMINLFENEIDLKQFSRINIFQIK